MHLTAAHAAVLLAFAFLAGCERPTPSPTQGGTGGTTAPGAAAERTGVSKPLVGPGKDPWLDDGQPQTGLPRLKLLVGPKELNTEICLTREAIMKGMMWRTNFAETNGMLFVFAQPFQTSFWMKNVPIDIDVGYLDSEGTLLEVHRLRKFDTNSVPSKEGNVQFALETPVDWYSRNGIKPGTLVRTDRGTLLEVFVGGNQRR